jgi:hypothetical protein
MLLIDIIRVHIYEQKKQFLSYLSLKKVLLQSMPSQISANNGPVTFLHQKEYLIAVERNISKERTEDRNKAFSL